jgi:hypothetical protein
MHFLAIIAHATGDITLQPKLKLNWCTANFLLQGLIGTRHDTHPIRKNSVGAQNTTFVLGKRPTVKKTAQVREMPRQKQKTLSQAMVPSGALSTIKQYKRVSSLVLWHQGRPLDSKKVFCYSYGRVCGFLGGEVKPFESYPDALRRVVQDKCTSPLSMEDWVKSAVSK